MRPVMRLYRRQNGYWYYEFERSHPKSLKTKDGDLAKKLYRRILRDFMLGKIPGWEGQKTVTLAEFKREYIRDRRNKREKKTVAADGLALRKLIGALGNRKLSLLDEKAFDDAIDCWVRIGNKASTINLHLRHLKSSLNKAIRLGYLKKNPLLDYEFLKEEPPTTRFLTPQDIETLARMMEKDGEHELAVMLWFYCLTGARRTEIFNLEARDIHMKERLIHIRESKPGKELWIPISPLLAKKIKKLRIPQVGRIFTRYRHPDTITHKMKKYLVRAGFKEFRLHDLRHTFGSLLAIQGTSQKHIKELLGHSDIRTSDRYTHLAVDHLREAVSNLGIAVKTQSMAKSRAVTYRKQKGSKN